MPQSLQPQLLSLQDVFQLIDMICLLQTKVIQNDAQWKQNESTMKHNETNVHVISPPRK